MSHRVIMLCLLEFHNLRRGVLTNSTRSADRTMPHTFFHIVVPKSACLLGQGTWSTPKSCATVTSRAAWDLKSFAHQRSTSASIAGTHTDEKDQWSHSADKHQQKGFTKHSANQNQATVRTQSCKLRERNQHQQVCSVDLCACVPTSSCSR